MKLVLVVACLSASLQACAGPGDSNPSYLGSALLADDATAADGSSAEPRPDLRHIGSNKILGAMAFQKVTGQAVDPSRLRNGQ